MAAENGPPVQGTPARRLGENTRAVHLPLPPVPRQQPLGTPVYRTAAFAFESSAEYAAVLGDAAPGYSYSRIDNPTVDAFAAAVAAVAGVFFAFARAGAHVVASAAIYG